MPKVLFEQTYSRTIEVEVTEEQLAALKGGFSEEQEAARQFVGRLGNREGGQRTAGVGHEHVHDLPRRRGRRGIRTVRLLDAATRELTKED